MSAERGHAPLNPVAFEDSIYRLDRFVDFRAWSCVGEELRLASRHYHGGTWPAIVFMASEALRGWWAIRVHFPLCLFLHRFGIHDHDGWNGGCLICEMAETEARLLQDRLREAEGKAGKETP